MSTKKASKQGAGAATAAPTVSGGGSSAVVPGPFEEQLRAAQAAMQLQQDSIAALQAQLHGQHSTARRQTVQPQQLQYETAAQGSALADWLFDLDRLFRQLGWDETEASKRVAEASLHWDRQVDIWWRGREQQARSAGAPIASWAAFVAALQANFVPTGDAEAAARELLRLRMKGAESMDAYMQRAALLLARSENRIDTVTAARIALEGVDTSRFPFCLAAVRALLRRAPTMPFNELRIELTEGAAHEPRTGTAQSTSSSGHSRHGAASGGAAAKKQLRISALERQLEQLRTSGGSDTEEGEPAIQAAPIGRQAGAAGKGTAVVCNKCGAAGHITAECSSKTDLRLCFVCGQPGHIAMRCKQRKGVAESGAEGSVHPKNV